MKEKKTADFVGSIVANIIGIAFMNTVLLWRHLTNGVILESWIDILWAANLSMIVQITGNMLLAFYRPARMYSLIQTIFAAVGLASMIVFYIVFPLDFSQVAGHWLNTLVRAVLIVAMAGTSIGVVVNLARAISGTQYSQTQNK
jgi:hypothetical protein